MTWAFVVEGARADVLDEFCESLRSDGRSSRPTARSFGWLISLLGELGVLSNKREHRRRVRSRCACGEISPVPVR